MPDLSFRKVATESTTYAPTSRASKWCDFEESLDHDDDDQDSSDQEVLVDTAKESASEQVVDGEAPLSVGSALHGTGRCKPCAWFWKPQSCANGRDCLHCHLCPSTAIKSRKKLLLAYRKEQEAAAAQPLFDLAALADSVALQEPPGLEASTPQELSPGQCPTLLGSSRNSPGSALHGTGECRPCAWVWHASGCQNGKDCKYCHLCPDGTLKERRKQKVQLMREQAELEEVRQQPGPSVGSAAHGTGECRPCAWFWKPEGCKNGKDCMHCHLCPEGELRRKRKEKIKGLTSARTVHRAGMNGKDFRTKLQVQAMVIQQQQQQLAQLQMHLQVQAMASHSAMVAAAAAHLSSSASSDPLGFDGCDISYYHGDEADSD